MKLEQGENVDVLLLTIGWKEFVEAHYLKKDDIVVFEQHAGELLFKVSMFDGKTGGENPTGYYVRNEPRPDDDDDEDEDVEDCNNQEENTRKRKVQHDNDHADHPRSSQAARKCLSKGLI